MSTEPAVAPPRLAADLPAAPVRLGDDETWEGLHITGSFAGTSASHVDIDGCRLGGVAFTGADIDRLRLIDSVLEDCELSGATLSRTSVTRVEFRRCRLSGLIGAGAQLHDVRFDDCKLDDADLRMTSWERSRFDGCVMTGADFSEAELAGSRFERCDLTRVDFTKAAMGGVHLAGSTLDDIRGGEALRGVVITSDQIIPLAMAVFSALGVRIDDDAGEISKSLKHGREPS